MEACRVVPDVLDKVPKKVLDMKYGNLTVDLGNTLTPTQVKDAPTLVTWGGEADKFYTLIMVDPDAPSRGFPFYGCLGEINHWLVINIPANDLSKGETIVSYKGSGPPPWTGLHRYIFVVFEQPSEKLKVDENLKNVSRIGRIRWSVRKFATESRLGEPIAANFFQAQYGGGDRQ